MHQFLSRTLRGMLVATVIGGFVITGPVFAAPGDETPEPVGEVVETEIDWFQLGLTTLDVAVLRPTGVLSTLGGFVAFVASLPFVGPTGHIETSWDIFVFNSYDYTFVRPIGE